MSAFLYNAQTYRIPNIECRRNEDCAKFAATAIQHYITEIVNHQISKRLKTIKLGFNLDGVKKLHDELSKKTYLWRNYTFYDDWGLSASIRASEEYQFLKNEVDAVQYGNNRNIHRNIFITKPEIKYNYVITDINILSMNEDMIDDYMAQCQVADGQYRIDNAMHTTDEARKYIHDSRYYVCAKAKVEINIDSDSGFIVDFTY